MTESDSTPVEELPPWDLGAGGRGFLVLLPGTGAPELRLWELDAEGRPMHDDARELLRIEHDSVLAALIIEPDGETTVITQTSAYCGQTCEQWVWALDERLSERRAWFDFSGDHQQ